MNDIDEVLKNPIPEKVETKYMKVIANGISTSTMILKERKLRHC
jgi:hypothetical protein